MWLLFSSVDIPLQTLKISHILTMTISALKGSCIGMHGGAMEEGLSLVFIAQNEWKMLVNAKDKENTTLPLV